MPFPMYAALLSSQLVVPIADRVPEFDVGPSCRDATVHDCLSMEKIARDKLVEAWPHFTAQDKATCTMEEKLAGPPSYVGWLTCLEINANARNAEAMTPGERTGSETGPAAHGGTSSGIHRRHAKH
jgi:hypothetical protein